MLPGAGPDPEGRIMPPVYLLPLAAALSLTPRTSTLLRPHGWLELDGTVQRVRDGNRFKLIDPKQTVQLIRLLHVETPELTQPYGIQAWKTVKKLILGKEVRVFHRYFDGHGRILGNVYVGKTWVNLELVRRGLAWARPDAPAKLKDAMKKAQAAKIGLWTEAHPIPPWFWRKGARVYRPGMEHWPYPKELPYSPSTNDRPIIGVGF